ncbi:MAG: TolC family protein, partial [Deltaproteobacteria bacterium]|nr:TolC family protein [Deltaproteobacteria bacterium]
MSDPSLPPDDFFDPSAVIGNRIAGSKCEVIGDPSRRNPMRSATHTRSRVNPIFLTFLATFLVTLLATAAHAEQAETEPEAAGEADSAEAAELNEAESAEMPDPGSAPVVVEGAEVAELSVREAVNLAIENNLGVEVARHAPLIAEEDISIAWGAYDPLLDGDFTYLNDREPNTSSFSDSDSIKTKSRIGSLGIGGLVPYLGASLSMDYTARRTKSNTGIASLSPRYDSGLAFGANVPLLKNLVWNEAWTQIEVSGTAHSAELENFRELVMDIVRETVSVYWSLVAEEEQLRVANKSLQTAEALLEQTQTQYEVGVKSKVEVIQSEAGVAARELEVIRADAIYRNTQDRLIDAIYGVRLRPDARLLI